MDESAGADSSERFYSQVELMVEVVIFCKFVNSIGVAWAHIPNEIVAKHRIYSSTLLQRMFTYIPWFSNDHP